MTIRKLITNTFFCTFDVLMTGIQLLSYPPTLPYPTLPYPTLPYPALPRLKVFDIVYISGKGSRSIVRAAVETSQVAVQDRAALLDDMQESVGDICHLPLDVRRRVLKSVVRLVEDRLVVVQCLSVTSLDTAVRKTQLETFFNTVTLAGEEGLVVKDLTSPYLIGEKSRKSAKWVKMKPEYGDQTTDLDLIVLGAESRTPILPSSHISFFAIFHLHL